MSRTRSTYAEPDAGTHNLPGVTQTGTDPHTETYTYTAGNTETRTFKQGSTTTVGQDLDWDEEGHLKSVTGNGQTTSYTYDVDGQRLTRTDSTGTTLYLPGGNELQVDKAGKATGTRYYSTGTQTVAMRTGGKLTFLLADHHGTTTTQVTADATQAITRRKTGIFGTPRGAQVGPWAGDKGFIGGTKDADTGLTHLGAREYDPAIGRFISVDPILDLNDPQTVNGYSYSGNNPITYSDPTGTIKMNSDGTQCSGGWKKCGSGESVLSSTGSDDDGGGGGDGSTWTRDDEMARRAAAAYRAPLVLNSQVFFNPNATQLTSMWFMGATPSAYYFDENDMMTQAVQNHIWMQVVRTFLTHRKNTKMGQTIKGLDYKTKYGAAMNELPLKGMMMGEVSDAIMQLLGDKEPDTAAGATRAVLGSFNMKATVTDYSKLNRRGTVEFEITQKMTVESLTRGVSKEGYESGAKDPIATGISNSARAAFPGGQKPLLMRFRWTESIPMPEPAR